MPARGRLAVAACVLAAGVLYAALRAPLLSDAGVIRGWNSDHAIFGLMAKRLAETGRIDLTFWGQGYLGALTPALAAPIRLARRDDPFRGPRALRLAGLLELASGILLFALAFRRLFGALPAALAAIFLVVGPPFLLAAGVGTTQPGPEIAFFLAGLATFVVAPAIEGPSRPVGPRRLFAMGLVAGLTAWLHPGAAFPLVAALLVLLLRTAAWRDLRPALRLRDRLLFRASALGWTIPRLDRAVLLLAEAWAFARLLAIYLSPVVRIPFPLPPLVRSGVEEPLVILAIAHALAAAPGVHREALARAFRSLVPLAPFVAGALVGFSPPLLRRLLGGAPPRYTFESVVLPDEGVLERIVRLPGEFLPALLGTPAGPAGLVLLVAIVLTLARLGWRRRAPLARLLTLAPGTFGGAAFAALVTALGFYFYVARARDAAAVRYLAPIVPFLFALLAVALVSLARSRPFAILSAALAAALLAAQLAGDRAETRRILSEPDPLALDREIAARGWSVCYAGYWTAYLHQFLTDERIRFIVYHGQDRRPEESAALRALPGPKCLVTPEGAVREFTAADEAAQGGPGRLRRAR